jgi:meiotically up-regulated gene 157 (Mug157) protein
MLSTRRSFLGAAAAAPLMAAPASFVSQRPPADKRGFTSEAVEARIRKVKAQIADPELAWLFENCYPNTLDTTVQAGELDGLPDTFVITGDIHAMWLRDSTAQVWPYLPLAAADARVKRLLAGVVHRQTRCVLIDPYANAFNFGPTGSEWAKDRTAMKPELHERKWEIDSLCYTVRLAHGYWKTTGDKSIFTPAWREAAALVVKTFREQQRKSAPGPYKFQRLTTVPSDSLPGNGYGNPTRPCGLIHSAFRPSDDACMFPFLVPSNFFAVQSLKQLAEIHTSVFSDAGAAKACQEFAAEVELALRKNALVRHPRHGQIWAYEVDGFGNSLFMDDANIPSLLSLPYLGCVTTADPTYRSTRAFILGADNPYYYRGSAAQGLGGPHSGLDMIWPLGYTIQALTSTDGAEIAHCLKMLKTTHAGSGLMHESFHKDDPSNFTRKWFAWANTLFGELVSGLAEQRPELLRA